MKNIWGKWKINSLTYFCILSFLLTGFIKNIFLILLIVVIHELGHLFFLKLFHYEITKIEIFPFGGITSTEHKINIPINKEIFIYFGGVLFQLLLEAFFFILYKKGMVLENTYVLFHYYNISIFFFNLLPIRPLDGGELMFLFLQKIFPYAKSITLAHYTSIFFLIGFILYNLKSNLNQMVIITFLLYKMIFLYRKREYFKNKFFLERFLYVLPYKKIEHNPVQNICLLKKETLHFFKKENKYIHEREVLREKFDKNSHF